MTMPRKLALFILIPVLVLSAVWLFLVPSLARDRIEAFLTEAGQKRAAIGTLSVHPSYILATDIHLDTDGFNTIDRLKARIDFKTLSLRDVEIGTLSTAYEITGFPPSFLALSRFRNALPAGNFSIQTLRSDFATPYGDIRIESNLNISSEKDGKREIEAKVKARQYQLGFDTKWSGFITPEGGLHLEGDVLDGRLNIGPARLARLSGWLTYTGQKDPGALTGQIDAGSGTMFDLPLQNIGLVLGGDFQNIDLLFRTGLSGLPGVAFSIDAQTGPERSIFESVLNIPDTKKLFAYLEKTKKGKTPPETLRDLGAVSVHLDYLEDRRFKGGPLPFSLTALREEKSSLNGHLLFYPGTLDVRGSAEMDEALAGALQDYLSIPEENRSGGALRLDGSVKDLLRIGTGVENDTGE